MHAVIDNCSKMVGRSLNQKDEIRAYIKARSKIDCSLEQLMTELSTAYRPSSVSYDSVRSWKKKFDSGEESIKNAPKSGRPKIVNEYDQEIPQSQTADNPVAPRGRAADPSRDTRKTN